VIDLARLTPEERALWERTFPEGLEASETEGDVSGLRLWAFSYICMLELGQVPPVVDEMLEAMGVNDAKPIEYMRRRRAAQRQVPSP
jgi:hypothetical protein